MSITGTDARTRTAETLRAAGCVFAEDEAALLLDHATDDESLNLAVARRVSGVPLEVILGWVMFGEVRVDVAEGVFVPRRRTVFLAATAAEFTAPGAIVVDMCCGTGAVGLSIALTVPDVELHAADIDDAALACARGNLARVHGHVHSGDLFDALPSALRGGVDVVVVNAPYVPTAEIALLPTEARDHEPRRALDGGPDGADIHRRVSQGASEWLRLGGTLLIETSRRQADLTVTAMSDAGLTASHLMSDEYDATVAVGRI